jgi:hypothetical protein
VPRRLLVRALHLYQLQHLSPAPDQPWDDDLHAQSVFRHVDDDARFARYSIRGGLEDPGSLAALVADEMHTLVTVREFRRVPFDATGLRLAVFRARPGRTAEAIAVLAHWAARAVSRYQPAYLLLAHSLEQPWVTVLVAGVLEWRTLQRADATPFDVDVLPELIPLLERVPDHYAYWPIPETDGALVPAPGHVSPSAV